MHIFAFVVALAALAWPVSPQSDATNVSPYIYIGCWTDSGNPRALQYQIGTAGGSSQATVEACIAACSGSYSYIGLEYYSQCYCANSLDAGSTLAPHEECNTRCDGNHDEWCGGPSRLSVYSVNGVTPSNPNGANYNPASAAASSRSARSYSVSQSKASVASSNSARSYSVSVSKANALSSRISVNNDKTASLLSARTSRLEHNFSQSNARDAASSSKSSASEYRASLRSAASVSQSEASESRASARSAVSASKASRASVLASPHAVVARDEDETYADGEAMAVEEAMAAVTEAPLLRDAAVQGDDGEYMAFVA